MTLLFVVPTLGDRPGLLRQTLQSVVDQGRGDVDLVVVGPDTDDVRTLVDAMGARLVPDTRRAGLSAALNQGLDAATPATEYFAWLGDDDYLLPGSLDATVDALRSTADAVLAYGWCDYVDEQERVVFRSHAGRLAARILPWAPNLIPQPGSLMRYDTVRRVGGLDEGLRFGLDLDLFLRLRREGRLVALPQTVACFRWHSESLTVSNGQASMQESDEIRMRYMPAPAARVYDVLRWPGRWALHLAKATATRRAART